MCHADPGPPLAPPPPPRRSPRAPCSAPPRPAPFLASRTPVLVPAPPPRAAPPLRRSLLWCLLANALTRGCQHTTSAAVRAAPQGLKEQTIAEVLEADPEMRKEIEEEMKNHQWGV